MNNKLVIFTILAFSFISSAIWLEFRSSNKSDNTTTKELNELKAELKELKLLLSSKGKEDYRLQQELKSNRHVQPVSQQGVFLETETEEELAKQEKIAMEDEKLEIEATVKHLQLEHQQEDIDEKWAPEAERNLLENFSKNSLEGSTLLETNCRSTFCRITIANNANIDFNPHEIMGSNFSNSEGFYNSTVDSEGRKITELYVSRSGYNLPAYDSEDSM